MLLRGASVNWEAYAKGLIDHSFATGSIVFPSGVTNIHKNAFAGGAYTGDVIIPTSVTSIGDSAFNGCSGLTSVTIPNSVTSIGNSAFYGCSGLESVVIPEGITAIGSGVFRFCSNLKTNPFILPSTLTSIGTYVIYQWFGTETNPITLVCKAVTPPTLAAANSISSAVNGINIYVPDNSVATYKAAQYWSTYATKIFPISEYTGEL